MFLNFLDFLWGGFVWSMEALVNGHFNVELEKGLKAGVCKELRIEKQQEGKNDVIEDAVKVLLLGLGEDINRQGLRNTPLRVAKALREGTRGAPFF